MMDYTKQPLDYIERQMEAPTARGLAEAVGRVVSDGTLPEGTKLPPIRTVAIQLGLSPTTVSAAWAMLVRAGTIQTNGRQGTVVSAYRPGPVRYRHRLLDLGPSITLDLSTGMPDPALLPDLTTTLRRLTPPTRAGAYLDDPLLPELARLLRENWPFPAGKFTVVDGAMDALALMTATHLRFGDRVAVENPCFPHLLDLLQSAGIVIVPVHMDEDGLLPEELAKVVRLGVRAVILQPCAQNPTGASLTPDRVAMLAAALADSEAILVEDDSMGPLAARPALSLGIVLPDRTIHIRSYSKAFGPELRLAAVGGPPNLIDPMLDRRYLGQGWTSRLLQSILIDLLTHTDSAEVVDNARRIYARRRGAVVESLRRTGIEVKGKEGINIWIPVADEFSALLLLAAHGVSASAGAAFCVEPIQQEHVRVTVGHVSTHHAKVAYTLAAAARTGAQTRRQRHSR